MDVTHPAPDYISPTTPFFASEAQVIRTELATYGAQKIMQQMHVSEAIASNVVTMYQATTTKPALWMYAGDVFKGFQAATITQASADFSQDHLLIVSGAYGVLRPYDMISPYRLEMRAKLAVDSATTLCGFWQDKLGAHVQTLLGSGGELCVLSSEEYAKPITTHLDSATRTTTPVFLDTKANGLVAQIPIYNKMMRGVMARWIADERIDSSEALLAFSAHGYEYRSDMGTAKRPAFFRSRMTPLNIM